MIVQMIPQSPGATPAYSKKQTFVQFIRYTSELLIFTKRNTHELPCTFDAASARSSPWWGRASRSFWRRHLH